MSREQITEWVKSLKVGDEVAFKFGSLHRQWGVSKIKKVNPSGRLTLENSTQVNPDGSIRGDKHWNIHPVTDEIRLEIWRRRAINKIQKDLVLSKLSNGDIRSILVMIENSKDNR